MIWIKCSDRMPEYNQDVLYCVDGHIYLGWLRQRERDKKRIKGNTVFLPGDDEWVQDSDCCYGGYSVKSVSHWMELPETPKDIHEVD